MTALVAAAGSLNSQYEDTLIGHGSHTRICSLILTQKETAVRLSRKT